MTDSLAFRNGTFHSLKALEETEQLLRDHSDVPELPGDAEACRYLGTLICRHLVPHLCATAPDLTAAEIDFFDGHAAAR